MEGVEAETPAAVSDAEVVSTVVSTSAVENIRHTLLEALAAAFPEESARWLSDAWDPDTAEGPPEPEVEEGAEEQEGE